MTIRIKADPQNTARIKNSQRSKSCHQHYRMKNKTDREHLYASWLNKKLSQNQHLNQTVDQSQLRKKGKVQRLKKNNQRMASCQLRTVPYTLTFS
jgi:hypothetical protein